MTIKEDIERAVRLVQTGRGELTRDTALKSEAESKAKEIREHRDLVRKTGVVDILDGLRDKGIVEPWTGIQWDEDGLGLEMPFNGYTDGETHYYSLVKARLSNEGLMINGVLVNKGELVDRVAGCFINPKIYSNEVGHWGKRRIS